MEMEMEMAGEGDGVPLAGRWREIHGSRNWEGLLEPLDLELRKELLRYGEFACVPNCAFNGYLHSRNLGMSFFPKSQILSACGFRPTAGYTVTRFIYSLAKNVELPQFVFKLVDASAGREGQESNWMGFVMVASDEEEVKRLGRRDIVIVWRGTRRNAEWLKVFEAQLISISASPTSASASSSNGGDEEVKVEKGFWSLFTESAPDSALNQKSAAEQVKEEVERLVAAHRDEDLSITCIGHSLGAALAILSAFHLAHSPTLTPSIPIAVFTWGGPRTGNQAFKQRLDSLGIHCLRVVNVKDILADLPPAALGFSHVGVKLEVDYDQSPYLKPTSSQGDWHNLDGYLHLIDGTHGRKGEFRLEAKRDLSLLNRSADLLLDSYSVPGIWWQVENKGLIQAKDGGWGEPQMDPSLFI